MKSGFSRSMQVDISALVMTGRKGNWFIGMDVRCYGVSWANFTLAGLMDGYGSHQGEKKKKKKR